MKLNKRQMELKEHLDKISSLKNSDKLLENFVEKLNLKLAFSDLTEAEIQDVFAEGGMPFNTEGDIKNFHAKKKKYELDNEERVGTRKMKDSSGRTMYVNDDGEMEYDEKDVIDDDYRTQKAEAEERQKARKLEEMIIDDFYNEMSLNESVEKLSKEEKAWKFAVYCVKYLKESSLDEIIKAKYPEEPEKVNLKKKEKIELVRRLAGEVLDQEAREEFVKDNNQLFDKIKDARVESGKSGAGTVAGIAAGGAAGFGGGYLAGQAAIASATGLGKLGAALVAAILAAAGAIGGAILGGVIAAGVGAGVAIKKINPKARKQLATLTKDEVMKDLSGEKQEALTEAVTYVDNCGEVKTKTAAEYNKDMHRSKTEKALAKLTKKK